MDEETDMTNANAWGEHIPRPVHAKAVPRFLPAAMAGLCVAAGILLAVAGKAGSGDVAPSTAVPVRAEAFVADTAAAHRKEVFDARRARFDAAHGSRPEPAVSP